MPSSWNTHICAWTLVAAIAPLACFQFPAVDEGATTPDSNTTGASSDDVSTSPGASAPTDASTSTESSPTPTSTDPTTTSISTATTTGPGSICGDGLVDGAEECDDGNHNDADQCTNACTSAICGDGIKAEDEACDDGNADDADQCSSACVLAVCGDGAIQTGEDCDDGGESATCDLTCTSVICGDGEINGEAGELCDYGDNDAGDTCSALCEATVITEVALGEDFTCVVFESGAARCWGQAEWGALGSGDTDDLGSDPLHLLPVPDIDVGGKVAQLSGGWSYACARLDDGKLRCWGRNDLGQLGYSDINNFLGDQEGELPTPDVDLGVAALQIAAGKNHTCAVTEAHAVRCWGAGLLGRLGYGDAANVYPPKKADLPGIVGASRLALGYEHSCVLQQDGDVRCWGGNTYGQLGLGHKTALGDGPGEMPPPVINLGGPVAEIAAGLWHTCARMETGQVRCWGHGTSGQLGSGAAKDVGDDAQDVMPPVEVNLGPGAVVKQVVAGGNHTCVQLDTGKVKCWGNGAEGALGNGSTDSTLTPEDFPPPDVGLAGPARLLGSHLGLHTCALLEDYSLGCWGYNKYGQLGYGHTDSMGDEVKRTKVGSVLF